MVHQNAEPAPGPGLELGHDTDQVVDAAEVLDDDPLDAQVLTPHLRNEFGVVAALDIDPTGPGHPRAGAGHRHRTRRGSDRGGGRSTTRRSEDHRTAVQQITGAQRKAAGVAVPVLQVDAAVFDADDRADVAALRILDDHAKLDWMFCRARLARARGKDVGSVAIHPAIVGILARNPRDDAPTRVKSS